MSYRLYIFFREKLCLVGFIKTVGIDNFLVERELVKYSFEEVLGWGLG